MSALEDLEFATSETDYLENLMDVRLLEGLIGSEETDLLFAQISAVREKEA